MSAGSIAGLALAGGASSRFGREKAVQPLAGRPLLAWSLAALDGVCAEVAVSGRPGSATWSLAERLGRRGLADDPRRPAGPLNGLAAGLAFARRAGHAILVTAPCDTPALRSEDLSVLLAALGAAPAAFATVGERVHGLCAAWRVDLDSVLGGRLDRGEHPSVQGWLAELGARPVAFDDPGPFRNVNTPGDLADLEAALERRAHGDA